MTLPTSEATKEALERMWKPPRTFPTGVVTPQDRPGDDPVKLAPIIAAAEAWQRIAPNKDGEPPDELVKTIDEFIRDLLVRHHEIWTTARHGAELLEAFYRFSNDSSSRRALRPSH